MLVHGDVDKGLNDVPVEYLTSYQSTLSHVALEYMSTSKAGVNVTKT
jgi:hypothetical protein